MDRTFKQSIDDLRKLTPITESLKETFLRVTATYANANTDNLSSEEIRERMSYLHEKTPMTFEEGLNFYQTIYELQKQDEATRKSHEIARYN